MKKRDLIKQLEKMGFKLERNGKSHDVYIKGSMVIEVPRHSEVNEYTAKSILKRARGL